MPLQVSVVPFHVTRSTVPPYPTAIALFASNAATDCSEPHPLAVDQDEAPLPLRAALPSLATTNTTLVETALTPRSGDVPIEAPADHVLEPAVVRTRTTPPSPTANALVASTIDRSRSVAAVPEVSAGQEAPVVVVR
jgi:hypothetical protein